MGFITDGRGQSEVIGFALVLSLSIITAGLIVVYGSTAFTALADETGEEQARNAMSKVSSDVTTVAFGDVNNKKTIETGLTERTSGGNSVNTSNESHITVKIKNKSDGTTTTIPGLDNQSMGSINYKSNNTLTSVENGGVWIKYGDGGNRMVSPPKIHYTGNTLTLPLIIIDDEKNINNKRFELSKASQSNSKKQIQVDEDEAVVIEVHSEHYLAWESFFQSHIRGNVSTESFDSNKTVIAELGIERDLVTDIDKPIISNGDVQATQSSNVDGGVTSSGDVVGEQNINGNTEEFKEHDHVTMNQLVLGKQKEIESSGTKVNLNDSGDRLLTTGQYHAENIWMDDETLILDVSAGNVEIYVDNEVYLKNDSKIEVLGADSSSGEVRVYVSGDYTLERGAPKVRIIGNDNSTRYQVYGTDETDVAITQDAKFKGLIYAPTDSSDTVNSGGAQRSGSGNNGQNCWDSSYDVCIGGNADVTGSIVGGSTTIGQDSNVKYDSDLAGFYPSWVEPYFSPQLFYLHVSKNSVSVDEQ